MSKLLVLYNLLISIGPKLQLVWPLVLALLAKFEEAATIIRQIQDALNPTRPAPAPGTLEMTAAESQEVLDAEAQIGQLLAADGAEAAFDGSRLRRLWKFLEDSGLADILFDLLKGVLAGAAG